MNIIGKDCRDIINNYINDLYRLDFNNVLLELHNIKFYNLKCITCDQIFKGTTFEYEIRRQICSKCITYNDCNNIETINIINYLYLDLNTRSEFSIDYRKFIRNNFSFWTYDKDGWLMYDFI